MDAQSIKEVTTFLLGLNDTPDREKIFLFDYLTDKRDRELYITADTIAVIKKDSVCIINTTLDKDNIKHLKDAVR